MEEKEENVFGYLCVHFFDDAGHLAEFARSFFRVSCVKEPGNSKRANMRNVTAIPTLAIGTCILEQTLSFSKINWMTFQH